MEKRWRLSGLVAIVSLFALFTIIRPPVFAQATVAGGEKKLETKIERMLSKMTDEEKVGQLMMITTTDQPGGQPSEMTRAAIQNYKVGSVILYGKRSPKATAEYINQLQKWAEDTRLGIPLLVSADLEYGAAQRMPDHATTFPRLMGIAATNQPPLAGLSARITAKEARAVGFNWNFAPVADVNTNPANPVIGVRSFGENTELVSEMTTAQVKAYQKEGVIASAKHFPGHGDTSVDSHLGLPTVAYDLNTLEKVHLPPFTAAIKAGTDSIMTAHIIVKALDPDLPATLSPKVLDGYLRGKLGYNGLIVTDAMWMDAISKNWGMGEATVMAIQAGADVVMVANRVKDQQETYNALIDAAKTGKLSKQRLNQSVKRVLKAKYKYHLDHRRYVNPDKAEKVIGQEKFKQAANEIGKRSVTLVKNKNAVLPLAKNQGTTFVAGVHHVNTLASSIEQVSGNQVTTWQASSANPTDPEIAAAVKLAENADQIVVASYSQSVLPEGQVKLIKALNQLNKPVAVVAIGLPYDIKYVPEVKAFMSTYAIDRWQTANPTMLRAAAEVLYGAQPGGKLPVSIEGLYSFGHGLSY